MKAAAATTRTVHERTRRRNTRTGRTQSTEECRRVQVRKPQRCSSGVTEPLGRKCLRHSRVLRT